MGTCYFCFHCPSLFLQPCQWQQFAKCVLDRGKMSRLFSHSHVRDVWNGGCAGCLLFENKALLQRVVFEELFLQFQKSQHPGETAGEYVLVAAVMHFLYYDQLAFINFFFFLTLFRANHQQKKQKFCRNSL